MSLNFTIIRHSNSDNLHLKLVGVFDGSSAMELINTIKDNLDHYSKIFIHTGSLSALLPFGEAVFIKNYPLGSVKSRKLVFTGDFRHKISLFNSLTAQRLADSDQGRPLAWQ